MIIIIGILAAIAIPMFLNQRNKAKDAGVKEGVHTLQVGIQSWAVDNADIFPADGAVVPGGGVGTVSDYIDKWPVNPFDNTDMTQAAAASVGDYNYDNTSVVGSPATYTLTGWLSNAKTFVVN